MQTPLRSNTLWKVRLRCWRCWLCILLKGENFLAWIPLPTAFTDAACWLQAQCLCLMVEGPPCR